ncbi:GntR family transcriptional regulator [Burkholderia sp. FERM BP-3421]|uniref:GntR family transcriptional regulator n=1 Tax=Burkholderia sp. FERM BP-3421 TaxID=1494466 RepID=UPI00235E713A|nr:GntR family transcriptional regulator [Burkholderia sp. FERM BP-3421]WDD92072.1 GntR family transcriptional regulator [Burkholderia sp. FERM BP-3421]
MNSSFDSTAGAIAASLRELIVDGTLASGERLVERDLADRFEVSRIPLREAIQRLAREGLVTLQRNRGATVRELSAADVGEIYDLRVLLEGDAIRRAVKRMDDEALARATLVHQLLGTADTPARQGALNREFHELLYAPCGNARQLVAIHELRAQVERYERLHHTLLADTPAFQHEHAQILDACRARNARRAQALTAAHLDSARAIVLRLVESG